MITIVGSSDLWPTPGIASAVLTIMVSHQDVYGVRSKKDGERTSMIEELVVRIAAKIGCVVVPWSAATKGSGSGFTRDVAMVDASGMVFAFFGYEGGPEGGTGHVVACALRRGIPVVAYGLDDHGNVVEVGSDPGDPFLVNVEAAWPSA